MRFGLICSEFPPKTRRHQDMGYGAMRTCAADARAREWTCRVLRQTAPLPRKVTDGARARQPRSRDVKRLRSLRFGGSHDGVGHHVGTRSPPPNRHPEFPRMSPRRVTSDPARGILEVEW